MLAGIILQPIDGVTDAENQPWTQMCDRSSCGIRYTDESPIFSVVCGQPGVKRVTPPPAGLICPHDSVVETIYMHWDEFGIHSIDGLDCRRALLPPPRAS